MSNITLGQAALWCGGSVEEKYADVTFLGANMDSRKILPGQLFVALEGVRDGHDFIPMALEKGAAVIITATEPQEDIPYVLVRSDRLALAQLGANFYNHPADAMQLIGVTGTNGKTTSTLLLKHICAQNSAQSSAYNKNVGFFIAL